MVCENCGREARSEHRFCVGCGLTLPPPAGRVGIPGTHGTSLSGRVAEAEQELLDTEFVIQEVDDALAAEASPPPAWQAARDVMADRWRGQHTRLVRLLGSLEFPEAITRLSASLAINPSDPVALFERGRAHQRAGFDSAAFKDYLLSAALSAADPEPHRALALMHDRAGRRAEAFYEYRRACALETDPDRLRAARRAAEEIAASLQLRRPDRALPRIEETRPRLERLVATLDEIEPSVPAPGDLSRLVQSFRRRLTTPPPAGLSTPPSPPPDLAPAPVADPRQRLRLQQELAHLQRLIADFRGIQARGGGGLRAEPLAEQHLEERRSQLIETVGPLPEETLEQPEEGYRTYAAAQVQRLFDTGLIGVTARDALRSTLAPAAPVASSPAAAPRPAWPAVAASAAERAAPPVPPSPPAPAPPAPPPKPFDWGAAWAAIFSERVLAAILGFGVLLVGISSLALLIRMWAEFGGETWIGRSRVVMPRLGFLALQFVLFLGVGHFLKERMKLRLSGLALISIAALWVPAFFGAFWFDVMEPTGNTGAFDVLLTMPMYGWLRVTLPTIPIWLILTIRYRGHVLTHGAVTVVAATAALAAVAAGLSWEWSIAAMGTLAVPLLLVPIATRGSKFQQIGAPLFWTAQAALPLVATALAIGYALGESGGYSLAFVLLTGAVLYWLAGRALPSPAYGHIVAALPIPALFLSVTEAGTPPVATYDALLVALGIAGLAVGRVLQLRAGAASGDFRSYLTPAYVVGYLAVVAAVAWPVFDPWSRMGVLYVAAGVAAVSARWTRWPAWTWTAAPLAVAAALITFARVDAFPVEYWGVGLGLLAVPFLASAVALRRAPEHAVPLSLTAIALAGTTLGTVIATGDRGVAVAGLPVTAAVSAAIAVMLYREIDAGLACAFTRVARAAVTEYIQESDVRRAASLNFLVLAVVLLPAWSVVARIHAGAPDAWAGVELMALAVLLGVTACAADRRLRSDPSRVLAAGAGLLLLAAPVYQFAVAGSTPALGAILAADVFLVAAAGVVKRRQSLTSLAAALLVLPFIVTIDQLLPTGQWPAAWAGLAVTYLAGAVVLRRFAVLAPVTLGLAWTVAAAAALSSPSGASSAMALWTLPVAAGVYAASAVLVHRRTLRGLAAVLEREGDFALPASNGREPVAAFFGLLAAAIASLWTALVLLSAGVEGAPHAFNPLGWAFAAAVLARLSLRRSRTYTAAALGFGITAASAAVLVGFDAESEPVLTAVLYSSVALAVLYRSIVRHPAPLGVAAVLLPLAIAGHLDLAGVDPLFWSTPLASLAATYTVVALGLSARRLARDATVMQRAALLLATVAAAWTFAELVPQPGPATEMFLAVGMFLVAAVYAASALQRGRVRYGHLAAWALAGGIAITIVAAPMSFRHGIIPLGVLGFGYVIAGVALRQPGRIARAFHRPLVITGYALTAIVVYGATFDLAARTGDVAAANAVYILATALVGVSACLFRSPALGASAAVALIAPFSLGLYDWLGETDALLAAPSTTLAFGWAGLAVAYLLLSLPLERRAARFSAAVAVPGYMLLAAAVWASLGDAARQGVVFGVIVAVAAASAVLTHRGVTTAIVGRISLALDASQAATRTAVTTVFATVAALLAPLWSLEVLAAVATRETAVQGLVLSIEAPLFLVAAAAVVRRGARKSSWPIYFTAFGMTVVAPVLAFRDPALGASTLVAGSAAYAVATYLFRRTAWAHLTFWIAAALLPAASGRLIAQWAIPPEVLGLGLMGLALAYTAATFAIERLNVRLLVRRPSDTGGPKGLGEGVNGPIRLIAIVLSVVALAFGVPATENGIVAEAGLATGAAVFGLGAVLYALFTLRFRQIPLAWVSVALAVTGYVLGVAALRLPAENTGLALLPGAAAALAAARVVRWRTQAFPGGGPAREGIRGSIVRAVSAWEAPFVLAALGLSAAAPALAFENESARLLALAIVTGLYAAALAAFRRPGWAYPFLAAAHLAVADAAATRVGFSYGADGLAAVVPTLGLAGIAAFTVRQRLAAGPRELLSAWALPFAAFAGVDMAASVVLSATGDLTGIVMSATYAVAIAAAAHATRSRYLPYAATAFVTGAVIFASRLASLDWSQAAVVWSIQGFVMWLASQLTGALFTRHESRLGIWTRPLRNAALRLSWFALAFVAAVLALGIFVPDRFGAAQVDDISAVMAVLGLLYLGMAFVARRVWFAYVAMTLLLASWTLQVIDGGLPANLQAYAIPVGLYLLAIAFFERRRSRVTLPVFIDLGAVLLLTVSAFWQGIFDEPAWAYVVLLSGESALLVLWGAATETRVSFAGGIAAFVVNALYQTIGLFSTLNGAVIGLIVGSTIIVAIPAIEWQRQQLIALSQQWSGRLSRWSW